MDRIITAFDYSMSCPAMCIRWSDNDFNIHFLTTIKKYDGSFLNGRVVGTLHFPFEYNQERFDNISNYFMEIMYPLKMFEPNGIDAVIEGYSMGSKGAVFNIGENQGILKYKLYKLGIMVDEVPPTVLKKFAYGKGNADKLKMAEAFVQKTGIDLSCFGRPGTSPSSDIIDAYFLAEYAYTIKNSK